MSIVPKSLHFEPDTSTLSVGLPISTITKKIPPITTVTYDPTVPIPDRVRGSYTTDFNIALVHEAILVRFASEFASIDKLISQLRDCENKLSNPMSVNDRRGLEEDIFNLHKRITQIRTKNEHREYLTQAIPLLESYSLVSNTDNKGSVSLWKLADGVKEDEDLIEKRIAIIKEYLDLANKYITVEVIEARHIKTTCPGCGADFSTMFIDEEYGASICVCGVQQDILSYAPAHRDYSRANASTRNNYEDRENFEKGLLRFQGKQKVRPPDKLYDLLETYFENSKSLPKRRDILKFEIDKDGRKPGTSLQMMIEALSATHNSGFYDDINLIMHIFWGWKLPEISVELHKQLMDDYDNTQAIYYTVKDKMREASLNVQWRLLAQLLARGFPCRKDSFKLQTSRDSLEFHQRAWKIMCDATGVPFVPII